MKYFLDENFPKDVIPILEAEEHEVIDIRGTSDEGLDDLMIFELAKKNEAIFITTDKDFFHTIHLNCKPHYGIIVIAISRPNANRIIYKFKWFLENYGDQEIKDSCFLISNNSCRIYR